jgi:DNA-binding HxlR family transcriptional regulator
MIMRNKDGKIRLSAPECNSALSAVGDALYVIGGKWKLRIIIALSEGNKRFNDLQRRVTGISARVLSNELKDLEMNGFVNRKVDAKAKPVVVEYELTDYSDSLEDVLRALHDWGRQHKARIMQRSRETKLEMA